MISQKRKKKKIQIMMERKGKENFFSFHHHHHHHFFAYKHYCLYLQTITHFTFNVCLSVIQSSMCVCLIQVMFAQKERTELNIISSLMIHG